MDTMLTGILTETESMYDRCWRDMEFCYNLIEQQRDMEKFINEALILASGDKQAIQEMVIINEGTFTDRIKRFFEKIGNFFKKIFDKFGASMSALFSEQKKYINKYSNIIMNCKYVASDIEDVKDHFKGIPRIIDAIENVDTAIIGNNNKYLDDNPEGIKNGQLVSTEKYPYDNASKMLEMKNNLPQKTTVDDMRDPTYNEFTKEGYWKGREGFEKKVDDNNKVSLDATFKNYFDGSENTVSWTVDQVESNFQTIINTTYSGDKYVAKLNGVHDAVQKKMKEISEKMEKYYKAQSDKIKQVISNGKSPNIDNNANNTNNVNNNANNTNNVNNNANNSTSESFDYKNSRYIDLFNEEIHATNTTKVTPSQNIGKNDIDNVNKAKNTVTSKQVNNMKATNIDSVEGINNGNKKDVLDIANTLLDIDITNRQACINASVQISSAIIRNMLSAFELANKDFFWIIKHHVQWYLANPGAEKKSENQTSRVKSDNIAANGNVNNNQ